MIRAGYEDQQTPLSDLQFRPICESDLPFLCELYASTRADELALVNWTDRQKQQFIQMQFNAQHEHYQKYYAQAEFLLISENSKPIGRLYIDRRDVEIRLVDIALVPESRGQGFGRAMLTVLIEEAREKKQPLTIHVEKNNPAMNLYIALGFTKIEDQGVYDLMSWSPEPE